MSVVLEVAIILILVVLNGLLAGSEIAVVSARKVRLRKRASRGDVSSARALELANSPNRFLSTVQIGITLIAVVAGAFGGTRVAASLAPALAALGLPAGAAPQLALVLVVMAITYLTLVIGELVPKRIALHAPERVAARVALPMQRLARAAAPIVRLLGASTDLVLRTLPLPEGEDTEATEEDIKAMIAHAAATGVLEPTEQQIVERLFRLSDATVATVATPRERVVWLDVRADADTWRERLGSIRHTRYIVADGDLDRHLGYVAVQPLLRRCLDDEVFELTPALRRPHVVPPSMPAFRLLELFQWSGEHIALVVDAAGRVHGVATLNDVLEGIIGDIPELDEVPVPGIIEREDGSWLVDGLLSMVELARFLELPEDDDVRRHDTVHAFMVGRLGGAPRAAAVTHWRGHRLEVVDMDRSRVDKVLVQPR